jgi:hypothetical protein
MLTLAPQSAPAHHLLAADTTGGTSPGLLFLVLVGLVILYFVSRMVRQITRHMRPFYSMTMNNAKVAFGNIFLAAVVGSALTIVGLMMMRG